MATGTQGGQGQGRVGTAGDDKMHLWRQMVEQKGDATVDRLGVDNVEVIKH